jgi:transcriptional regulator with XRE-family HTH domain
MGVNINDVAMKRILFTPRQCRAARALLNWSQEDLVRHSSITKKTIADFERGVTQPRSQTLNQIVAAFEAAGIEFLNGKGRGVRIKLTSGQD